MSNDQETVEEAPVELTQAQKRVHAIDEVRSALRDALYNREAAVIILGQHPTLLKAAKEIADRIAEAQTTIDERWNLKY